MEDVIERVRRSFFCSERKRGRQHIAQRVDPSASETAKNGLYRLVRCKASDAGRVRGGARRRGKGRRKLSTMGLGAARLPSLKVRDIDRGRKDDRWILSLTYNSRGRVCRLRLRPISYSSSQESHA